MLNAAETAEGPTAVCVNEDNHPHNSLNDSYDVRRKCHPSHKHRGPTGPAGTSDVAWAYSLSTGPVNGYPFVDISISPKHFIELENQNSSADIVFDNLTAPNSGTRATFLNPGTYLIQFSLAGLLTTSHSFPYPVTEYFVGVFKGTAGGVPNSLPNGNLFDALADDVFTAATLTNFLIYVANAGDTLALGNASFPLSFLFLQQATYTPASGPTTASTTAGISIIRLK